MRTVAPAGTIVEALSRNGAVVLTPCGESAHGSAASRAGCRASPCAAAPARETAKEKATAMRRKRIIVPC